MKKIMIFAFLITGLLIIPLVHAGPQLKWKERDIIIWVCPNMISFKKQIKKAASLWEAVVEIKFKIMSSKPISEKYISICGLERISSKWKVRKTDWAQEQGTYLVRTGELVNSEIWINFFKFNWEKKRNKMKKVLLHELGHSLGFKHREAYYSVMNSESPHFRIFKKDKQIARKRYKHILKR